MIVKEVVIKEPDMCWLNDSEFNYPPISIINHENIKDYIIHTYQNYLFTGFYEATSILHSKNYISIIEDIKNNFTFEITKEYQYGIEKFYIFEISYKEE